MVQTANATQESVGERAAEIRHTVAEIGLKRAMRRLHDLANDFADRETRNEVVALNGRLSDLYREVRRGEAKDEEVRRNEIRHSMLAIVDQIESDPEVPGLAPGGTASEPDSDPSDRPDTDSMAPDAEGPRPERKEVVPLRIVGKPRRRGRRRSKPTTPRGSGALFECEGLGHSFRGFSLTGVDLTLRPGEVTALVGVNGAGKTTLLRMIAGELAADQGSLRYPAIAGNALPWGQIRDSLAYVPQAPPRWYGKLRDNLHFAAAERGVRGRHNRDEVERIVYRLSLDDFIDHGWGEISGGYKMRFELARALLGHPKLLVLDEPLAPLDVVTQQIFLQDLRDLTNSSRDPIGVILSSQHLHEVESVADQLLFLDGGRPSYCGRLDAIREEFEGNLFEVSTKDAPVELLTEVLERLDCVVDVFGSTFNVYSSDEVGGGRVLRALLDANIEVAYFRDISGSSRRLFETRETEL